MIETQHLKECEDNDYMMMERLLQTRCSIDEDDISPDDIEIIQHSGRRILRRETAIELPITPSKTATTPLDGDQQQDFVVKNERQTSLSSQTNQIIPTQQRISPVSSQNSPRNSQYATYLNPTVDTGRLFKKSSESLQKNSSTETDCSHPYKAIKQGSTETNTSLNSSFAIDNSSITNDMSLDHDTTINHTVIENIAMIDDPERTPLSKRAYSLGGTGNEMRRDSKLNLLKKQYSIDQGIGLGRPKSDTYDTTPTITTPQRKPHVTTTTITTGTNLCPTILTNKLQILQESSSTSTEDAKDEINIPSISTNTVQDEIAKLSSEIKNNNAEENKDPPFNETMC